MVPSLSRSSYSHGKATRAHLEREPAGFWKQTLLLCDKHWKTKGRFDKKNLIVEMAMAPTFVVGMLLLFQMAVTLYPDAMPKENTKNHAQLKSIENATDVMDSKKDIVEEEDVAQGILGQFVWYTHAIGRIRSGIKKSRPEVKRRRKKRNLHEWEVHVTPKNSFTEDFTSVMGQLWALQRPPTIMGFRFHPSESDLLAYFQSLRAPDKLTNKRAFPNNFKFGLVLPESWPDDAEPSFPYKIRINSRAPILPPNPREKYAPITTCRSKEGVTFLKLQNVSCPVSDYLFSDFLALQLMVEETVLSKGIRLANLTPSGEAKMTVKMENMPKTGYEELLNAGLRSVFILISITPLSKIVHSLLVYIVTDKIEGVKDGLQMVGFSDWAYWLSWLATYMVHVIFFSVLYTIHLSAIMLPNMDVILLFLLYFLFGLSIITASFALSPLFDNPKTAGVTGAWLTRAQQYLVLIPITLEDPTVARVLSPLYLFSPYAFTRGLDVSFRYFGVGWSDLKMDSKAEPVLLSLIFLTVDNILYVLLALYLDNVLPSQYGVKKHPLFFLSCFGCFFGSGEDKAAIENVSNGENVEDPRPDQRGREAIRVQGITKTYHHCCAKEHNRVLRGVYLDIYPGEITALLGKNGVGKSTLFSIITGRTAPSAGQVSIYGLNIRHSSDLSKVRRLIGVCFQQDLQFQALTVEEHLQFYGRLRGLKRRELAMQLERILHELELDHLRYDKPTVLSGGERRKLSVAMALVGDSPVILLDEPSAGLDPTSRRHLWTLLQQQKKDRVILITTHFMDEADILADRKAILHNGRIACMGTSLFLKNRFGHGYHLTVELNNRDGDTLRSDEIVKKWIPAASVTRDVVASEVEYSLPVSESSKFQSLFADLEYEVAHGKAIKSFGISMARLDEVFFSFLTESTHGKETIETALRHHSQGGGPSEKVDSKVNLIEHDETEVKRNFGQIFVAFCLLRFNRLRRSVIYTILLLIVPGVLTAAGLAGIDQLDVAEQVNFTDPTRTYPNLRIAVKEDHHARFQHFLKLQHIDTVRYSGEFAELVTLDVEKHPLAAAVTILKQNFTSDPPRLSALMRINGTFLHAPPIVLDLLSKYFSSQVLTGDNSQYRKSTLLQAEPLTEKYSTGFSAFTEAFSAILILCGAFVLTSSGLMVEIIYDREIRAREQLRRCQVTFTMYFLPLFAVFGVLSVCVVLGQVILIAAFQIQAFDNFHAISTIFFLLLIHTIPCMLAIALFSYPFDNAAQAQIAFIPVALHSANAFILVLAAVDFAGMMISDMLIFGRGVSMIIVRLANVVLAFINVFYIPSAVLYWIMRTNIEIQGVLPGDKTGNSVQFGTYFTLEIVDLIVVMLFQTVIFLVLLVIVDYMKNGLLKCPRCCKKKIKQVSPKLVGEAGIAAHPLPDVVEENARVDAYFASKKKEVEYKSCVLAVQNLQRKFGKFQAVNGVSFMVEAGEVLVVVGHNGAGKTTTLGVIVGDVKADSGKVKVCGHTLVTCCHNVFNLLGFCPQYDPLWENITVREHLLFYMTVRGIPVEKKTAVVNHCLTSLGISEDADKYSQELAGGTRRKLSYSIAMAGTPKIVVMDEPTSGMDPQSKRLLWSTVVGTFRDTRGAVMTTHSMEEAEILSTRVAIMVKGKLACIGTPHYLKTMYGQGYTLEVKLKRKKELKAEEEEDFGSAEAEEPERNPFHYIIDQFPGTVLVEQFRDRAVFTLSMKSISQAFGILESLKAAGEIEEYSLSQSTLEQIFLHFAADDEDEDDLEGHHHHA